MLIHSPTVVSVLLPIPIDQAFDYLAPSEEPPLGLGCRVLVPFGKSKFLTGIVSSAPRNTDDPSGLKSIAAVYDTVPMLTATHLDFLKWIASYYMTPLGKVLKVAFPLLLAIDQKTYVVLEKPSEDWPVDLSGSEQLILDALSIQSVLLFGVIQDVLGKKDVLKPLRRLEQKELISIQNQVKQKHTERQKTWIVLPETLHRGEGAMEQAFGLLSSSEKQREVFLKIISDAGSQGVPLLKDTFVKSFPKNISHLLTALEKKSLIKIVKKNAHDIPDYPKAKELPSLAPFQLEAFQRIQHFWFKETPVLLHGITASGKTEVYIHLIQQKLEEKKQVLFLTPEITMTAQLVSRFKKYFGQDFLVYHSLISPKDRLAMFRQVSLGSPCLVLGVRSSVFLPFSNLGLIIIDEEHDASFKNNAAPYYNTRDIAVVLAKKFGAQLLLGSATPSFESFRNAERGRFSLVTMHQKYTLAAAGEIRIVDMSEKKPNQIKYHFSDDLYLAMKETLAQKRQVLLFQNKRGFSPLVKCQKCYHIPQCRHCDVHLVYHKSNRRLICHYCGYFEEVYDHCSQCGSQYQQMVGLGTQKLEEYTALLFPEANIGRLDGDVVKRRNGLENALEAFESGATDILVGTQIITKSLSFRNVSLMGVMDADTLLRPLDFRTSERAFQTMVQAVGRVGRYGQTSQVIIQTTQANNPLFQYVQREDYHGFYRDFAAYRRQFRYPPFLRIIDLELAHAKPQSVAYAAKRVAEILAQNDRIRVLGPASPPVARVRNVYLQKVLLKFGAADFRSVKRYVAQELKALERHASFRQIRLKIDVDP